MAVRCLTTLTMGDLISKDSRLRQPHFWLMAANLMLASAVIPFVVLAVMMALDLRQLVDGHDSHATYELGLIRDSGIKDNIDSVKNHMDTLDLYAQILTALMVVAVFLYLGTAALTYKEHHERKGAITGLIIAGTLSAGFVLTNELFIRPGVQDVHDSASIEQVHNSSFDGTVCDTIIFLYPIAIGVTFLLGAVATHYGLRKLKPDEVIDPTTDPDHQPHLVTEHTVCRNIAATLDEREPEEGCGDFLRGLAKILGLGGANESASAQPDPVEPERHERL